MTAAKRFLVLVRAGDQSLHPQWTQALSRRSWDLVVSYFGDDPDRFREPGAVRIDDRGPKWQGLHALLTREAFWRDYDYIWLPDDDLAADQDAIDGLFRTMAQLDLALAQPALSWASFYSHPVTIRHPSFSVRLTNFVEIMAPCFACDALARCLPTFAETITGWGLDLLWPRLLNDAAPRCAIVDEVEVTHTRPVGGPSYANVRAAGTTPQAECEALLRKYGISGDLQAQLYAAIDRDGHRLEGTDPADAAILRKRLDRDWAAFQSVHRSQAPATFELQARFTYHAGAGNRVP